MNNGTPMVARYQLSVILSLRPALPLRIAWRPTHRRPTGRAAYPLYDQLLALIGSPVTAMNRAVAVARAHGAQVVLDALDTIRNGPLKAATD